jgi:hypothetical protein
MTKLNQPRLSVDTASIIRPLTIMAGVLLIYFILAGRTKLFNDADTLWHIAVGRTTLHSGLSTQDEFSFTRHGERWIANQWLAECVMAAFDWLGGLDGVLVLTVTVLTATYLALSYRWLAQGFDPLLAFAFIALFLSASAYTINARPHIVSIGLLGWVFALLRDVEDGRSRLVRLAWLVPVFVLWSNLHGGVLGGLGTFGLVAAGWTVQWIRGAAAPVSNVRDAGVLWLCVAGCSLALIATPYGTGSIKAWLTIMNMSLPELIIEHAPLQPGSLQGILVIVVCIIYLAVFAATPHARSRPTFWLPLVWFVLTCLRIRHAPLFAIVAGVAMADLLPHSRLAPWLTRRRWLRAHSSLDLANTQESQQSRPPGLNRIGRRSGAITVRMAIIVLLMTTPLLGIATWRKHVGPLPLIGAGWVRPPARVWPEGLIGPLKAYADEHRDGTPVFNEPILGGFLIYHFSKLQIFIDGRCELYGEPFLRDFVAAWRDPARVGRWHEEFGFRAALIEADSPLRSYFDASDQWRLVAEAPGARFYRMQAPALPGG